VARVRCAFTPTAPTRRGRPRRRPDGTSAGGPDRIWAARMTAGAAGSYRALPRRATRGMGRAGVSEEIFNSSPAVPICFLGETGRPRLGRDGVAGSAAAGKLSFAPGLVIARLGSRSAATKLRQTISRTTGSTRTRAREDSPIGTNRASRIGRTPPTPGASRRSHKMRRVAT
jgi:hypothetical protein